MSAVFQPVPPRAPPVKQAGVVYWLRTNLFADWKSSLTTVVLIGFALFYLPPLFDWAIVQAVLQPNADVCQQARGTGACWGVIVEKYRLIIFGRYPYEEQWRPEIATGLLVGPADGQLRAHVLEAVAGRAVGRRVRRRSSS